MLTVSLFTAYAAQTGERTYADYIDAGMRISAQAGDVYPGVTRDFFKAKEVLEYLTSGIYKDVTGHHRMVYSAGKLLRHVPIRW